MVTFRAARRALIAATVLLSAACTTPALAEVAPEYFDLPAGFNTSFGISAAADGSVWFAANTAGSGTPVPGIGRLTPSQASPGTTNGISTFPTPNLMTPSCCANAVRSVAVDSAHNRVWFSQNEGIVGYANPEAVTPGTSNGMLATMLPGFQDLWDIAVAPSGLAWFSEYTAGNVAPYYYGDKIASIDSTLAVHELENIALQGHGPPLNSERYDAKPEGITIDASEKPWFAESSAGLPGYRIATAPGTGGYGEYLIEPCQPTPPCSGSNTETGPTDVAVAKDGSVWFTNEIKNEVGRLDVGAGTFTNYSLPAVDPALTGGQARAISVAPDGTLWVAEFGFISHPAANAIVRIVPSQPTPTATVYKLGAGHTPIGVAPDTKGNVWFSIVTESPPSLIGRLAGVVGGAQVSEEPGTTGGPTSTPPGTTPPPGKALTPASVGVARVGPPQTSGNSLSVEQICVGPPSDPCSLIYLLSAGEYVTGFPGAHASAAKKKTKGVVLGRKAVTLYGGEHRKITVTLNAAGKKLLKRKGKLTLFFTATQAGTPGVPAKLLKHVKVTLRYKH